jgi:MSHA biogenesis protein MshK
MTSIREGASSLFLVVAITFIPAATHALQDPTRPNGFRAPEAQSAQQRSFDLASIIIGAKRKIAVIDGQARREGQTFEGVRVRRIYPDRVELIDQGRVRILKLDTLPQVRSSQ